MKKLLAVCAAAVLLLSLAACGKTDTAVVITTKKDPTTSNEVQGVGTHHAEIDIQDYGTITVELDGDAAQPTDGNGTIPADQQPVITAIRVID